VRLIAATNRDPQRAVDEGRLREDLFYRLNVFPVHLPPLRARRDDIGLLADHFLQAIGRQEGVVKRASRETLAQWNAYAWPGNVRELRNIVHRAYVMAPAARSWTLPAAAGAAPEPVAARRRRRRPRCGCRSACAGTRSSAR
jgi:DNA-binding NtrC family response regulator